MTTKSVDIFYANERQIKVKMKNSLETLYHALIQSTDDFIYINDFETGTFQYPKALVEMFPLPGQRVSDPLPVWEKIVHPNDWDRFYRSNIDLVNGLTDDHLVEFRARNRKGEYVWLRCRGKMMRDDNGKQMLFAGIITLMGRQNKIDPLTQLLNHREFYTELERDLHLPEIEQLAVLMLDVDEFRQINELYDRTFGDWVLKTLGQMIQSLLPENASLFRMEKDKLGILMTNAWRADAEALYREIQEHLLQVRKWKQHRLNLELSAGCAMYPEDSSSAEELYRYADYALQAAKKSGKNHLTFFTRDILQKKVRSLELLRQLMQALQQDFRGFYLNYQPQVHLTTGEMKGVEVLMRWKDAEGTNISPAEFIPILEENGLICQTGLWILRTAFREAKEWIRKQPDFSISINVSALQFLDETFLDDLYRIIEEEAFPCENLVIELTESFAFKNIEILQEKFNDMRNRKIRIALDDFGTGYSSLAALKDTPVDIVKIDRAFVQDLLHNQFDATFISLVTEICHTVSISVCLEGIEHAAEYELVRQIPLDFIQGYYFGRPADPASITEALETQPTYANLYK